MNSFGNLQRFLNSMIKLIKQEQKIHTDKRKLPQEIMEKFSTLLCAF